MPSARGKRLAGLERARVPLDAGEGPAQPLGRRGRIGDRLQWMQRPKRRAGGGEGVERLPIEQAGEVEDHLARGDGCVAGQLGGDLCDGIVRSGDQNQRRLPGIIRPASAVQEGHTQVRLPERPREPMTHPSRADDDDGLGNGAIRVAHWGRRRVRPP